MFGQTDTSSVIKQVKTDSVEGPKFKGDSLNNFIKHVMIYPMYALEAGVDGTVYVRFEISETGKIECIEVLRGPGYGLNEEAVRMIKLTNNLWTPGKSNGKPERCFYMLPIKFKLQ